MERITPVSEPDLAKLSEASEQSGIPTDILKLIPADGLLRSCQHCQARSRWCPTAICNRGLADTIRAWTTASIM
jgi:hypothetical protein